MSPHTVEDALFASLEPLRLAGSRCRACGCLTFPAQDGCPRCTDDDMAVEALPETGTLWTFTIQAFEPKPPFRAPAAGFAPYGVGYVDLGAVLVESLLVGDDFQIGMPMRLVRHDTPAGTTYAFEADR